MPFYFSSYNIISYGLVILGMIIAVAAQMNVSSAFNRYSRLNNARGYTGYDVARFILDQNGLQHVKIEQVPGSLTDHFDPSANIVRLSQTVYHSTSVAAVGVAAHECGHAVQYQVGYVPLKIRKAIIPVTQIGSTLAWPLALAGLLFGWGPLVDIGILLFVFVVVFQLITLPVEFNASSRALATIRDHDLLAGEELTGAKRMLQAAALTYVAALLTAVLNLVRLLLISNRRNR